MSVISNLVVMPNRIAIACDYLSSLGPVGGAKDDILKQLSPLSSDEGGETTGGGSTIASSVMAEMESLGLITINNDGSYSLARDLLSEKKPQTDWQTALRPILRARLTDPNLVTKFKQEDVGDALAWLLAQDPFRPIAKSRHHADLLREQLGEGDALMTTIGNDSRFQNLLYWARYIGVAEWFGNGSADLIIPDPTRAFTDFLPYIFEKRRNLNIGEFAARIAAECDIFEGGSIREAFEQRLRSAPRSQHHFARSTSLCLTRLEYRGMISLREESDAETWILDLGQDQRRVTAIDYLPKDRK